MEVRRYQWVGLLAGVPLFSGAWLSAFYNSPWWGIAGLVISVWGLYVANQVERRVDNQAQAKRGIVAGLLAGAMARVLGYISALIAGVSGTAAWNEVGDMFRSILAGDWMATILLLLVMGLFGTVMAVLEPDAKTTPKRQGKRG